MLQIANPDHATVPEKLALVVENEGDHIVQSAASSSSSEVVAVLLPAVAVLIAEGPATSAGPVSENVLALAFTLALLGLPLPVALAFRGLDVSLPLLAALAA